MKLNTYWTSHHVYWHVRQFTCGKVRWPVLPASKSYSAASIWDTLCSSEGFNWGVSPFPKHYEILTAYLQFSFISSCLVSEIFLIHGFLRVPLVFSSSLYCQHFNFCFVCCYNFVTHNTRRRYKMFFSVIFLMFFLIKDPVHRFIHALFVVLY
jgi:hypothetical protein